MKQTPMIVSISHFVSATSRSKEYAEAALKRADDIRTDARKEERIKKHECKSCFYILGRIGGAAITERDCALCGKTQHFGNTCTDVLCDACARANNLCKHCGADIDLMVRRKKWPVKSDQSSALK